MAEFGSRLEVICLESDAFYALVDEVVARLKDKHNAPLDKWIDDEEAMRLLRVSSKTTMQKYRDDLLPSNPIKTAFLANRQRMKNQF